MSRNVDPHQDLAAILACDVVALTPAGAVAVLASVRRLRGRIDNFEATVTNHISAEAEQGRSAPAEDVLTRNAHVSASEARKRQRRAKALANTKAFGDALAKGDVAAEHADVLADLTLKLDDSTKNEFFGREHSLLAKATTSTPEQFARHCRTVIAGIERDEGIERNKRQRRDTYLTVSVQRDGMH